MKSPLSGVSDNDWKETPKSVRGAIIELIENPVAGLTTIEAAARIVGRASNTLRHWINRGWIASFSLVESPVVLVRVQEVAEHSNEKRQLNNSYP